MDKINLVTTQKIAPECLKMIPDLSNNINTIYASVLVAADRSYD